MKYKPMLDGFELELLSSIDTSVEKAVVEYEIPFANGAILDDMGVKARRFQVRTVWKRQKYEEYEYFAEHAALPQVNAFVHPELGVINGRIKSVNILHDNRRQYAEISFEFIEDSNPDVAPAFDPPLEANLEDGLNKAVEAMTAALAAECEAAGLDTSVEVDPDKPLAGQISAMTVSAGAFLARLDQTMSDLRNAFDSVMNPLESAVGMINYAANLPGALIGTVARAVERAAMVASAIGNTPATFISSLKNGVTRLTSAGSMLRNNILGIAASIGSIFVGRSLVVDEAGKAVVRQVENTQQWRPDGTMLPVPQPPPVLTVDELDDSLSRARELIQEGIDAARAAGNVAVVLILAQTAAALTRYVKDVKLERDRIINVEVEDDTPLHLLCLRHGLPHTYADRICTINGFMFPSFVRGEVRLYERHS